MVPGCQLCHPIDDALCCQCNQKRRNVKIGDDQSIDKAHRRTGHQPQDDTYYNGTICFSHPDNRQHRNRSRKGSHRANRKVDSSQQNRINHAADHRSVDGNRIKNAEHVVPCRKDLGLEDDHHQHHCQQNKRLLKPFQYLTLFIHDSPPHCSPSRMQQSEYLPALPFPHRTL